MTQGLKHASKPGGVPALALALAPLTLALSACGGEGGGGMNSTPTPTPTTTPTPNDDLVKPLTSETFTNDAVTGSASFSGSGTGSSSVAKSTVTFQYDASTGAYAVSTAGRSQTFRPADKDAALSAGDGDVYVRKSGSTTDSLFITHNSAAPGRRSAPQFQYVGAGVWQHTTASDTSGSGTVDAFAYGVQTPDAAVPRTGSAVYDVGLYGVAAYSDAVLATRGLGTLRADFASNKLSGSGTLQGYFASGAAGESWNWGASATISSTANTFNGAFVINPGAPTSASGSLTGRFYGPKAQELGGAFTAHDNFVGTSWAGVMLGKDDSLFPTTTSLRDLVADIDFARASFSYTWLNDSVNGPMASSGEPNPTQDFLTIRYSQADSALVLDKFYEIEQQPLLAADRNSAKSSKTFDVYTFTRTGVDGTPVNYTVKVLRTADDNPAIQLTYTSLVAWNYATAGAGRYSDRLDGYAGFGIATPASGLPRTGTASYALYLYGQSDLAQGSSGRLRSYEVSGTGTLNFDFGGGTFGGSLNPTMTDPESGTRYDLGNYALSTSAYAAGSPTFVGSFSPEVQAKYPYAESTISGQFTGPNAQELFGLWKTATDDPRTGATVDIFGAMAGKKN